MMEQNGTGRSSIQNSSLFVQDHYADDFAWCYGCGRLNEHGLHIKTRWNGDETLTEYTPLPLHIAIPGFTYGGLIASLVDCHGTGSAALALLRHAGRELGDGSPVPRTVTASLHVDFRKPTPLGPPIHVQGRIVEVTDRKVTVHSDVVVAGQVCAQGVVVAVLAPQSMVVQ
jgi:acyl-CoA hydrolase